MAERVLECLNLGIVDYDDGLEIQEGLRRVVLEHEVPDQLLLLEHPPVITAGRNAKHGNLLLTQQELDRRGILFRETGRGGDVTFHGPGQIVGYPILDLNPDRRDVVRYVRDLEEALIRTLADFGVAGTRLAGLTGVWVGSRKLAAIGVRISRWVTTHGFAFNVSTDPRWFDAIVPCGIQGCEITSLQALTGQPLDFRDVRGRLAFRLAEVFERELSPRSLSAQSVQVVVWRASGSELQVLLLKRVTEHGGFWQPVTGLIEKGEEPQVAAQREVREETGLDGVLTDLRFVRDFQIGRQYSKHSGPYPWILREHAFAMQVHDAAVSLSPDEHEDFRWVSLAQAQDLLMWKGNRQALQLLETNAARGVREEIAQ
ncbi:MAG TPA: lipoyl(octanoyl) transferase LipB [bacterium]|nr:lipoyl(octanoyl) transferase LipB [bacterium]